MLGIMLSSWLVLTALTGLMCVKKITLLSIPRSKCFGEFFMISFSKEIVQR